MTSVGDNDDIVFCNNNYNSWPIKRHPHAVH